MATPKLKTFTPATDGFSYGSYSDYNPKGATITLTRSILEGDSLVITSKRSNSDAVIDKAGAVRMYDSNNVKVFDGYIRQPAYERRGNNTRTLTTKAFGWEKELDVIGITELASYVDTSIDDILQDLVTIANDNRMTKSALYAYDTSKLPYHPSAFSDLVTITFSDTIGSALKDISTLLGISDTRNGQWTVKVDSLQSDNYIYLIPTLLYLDDVVFGDFTVGIGFADNAMHPYGLNLWAYPSQDVLIEINLTVTYTDQSGNTGNTIDIVIPAGTTSGTRIPLYLATGDTLVKDITNVIFIVGSENPTPGDIVVFEGKGNRILPDIKLRAPKYIWKDYSNLINHVVATGTGVLKTQTLGALDILSSTAIGSNNLYINPTAQPTTRNYLKITITNTSASEKIGSVSIRGFSGIPESDATLLTESYYFRVPAGGTAFHVTNNRYYSISTNISPNTGFHLTGFLASPNLTFKVEEYMYGKAGRSVNKYGLRYKSLVNYGLFDTQLKTDMVAHKMAQLYQNPITNISVDVKPDYVSVTDYSGKIIRLYDDFISSDDDFICMKQILIFSGDKVWETLEGMKYNDDWEYTE